MNRTSTPAAHSLLSLAAFLILCFAVAAAGAYMTASSVRAWYDALNKPAFNPPDWVFAPVWTVLYAMIAIAGWRLWLRRAQPGARYALGAWLVQLGLNFGWTLLFFRRYLISAAFVEIVILLMAILATMVLSWRIDRLAGALLAPYAAWVGFAAALNAALWRLN